jgi:hypothetical protein
MRPLGTQRPVPVDGVTERAAHMRADGMWGHEERPGRVPVVAPWATRRTTRSSASVELAGLEEYGKALAHATDPHRAGKVPFTLGHRG